MAVTGVAVRPRLRSMAPLGWPPIALLVSAGFIAYNRYKKK